MRSRARRPCRLLLALPALAACRSRRTGPIEPPPPPPVTRLGQFKAVLINGGGKPQINFQSHLTHVRTLVDFLRANDVAADDIAIFSSDGADPSRRPRPRAPSTASPTPGCCRPRLAHRLRPVHVIDSAVDGFTLQPATREALRAWFESEGRQLGAGDTLLLYVTDHGEAEQEGPHQQHDRALERVAQRQPAARAARPCSTPACAS